MSDRAGEGIEPAVPVTARIYREVEVPTKRRYPWLEMGLRESFLAPTEVRTTPQFGGRLAYGMDLVERETGERPRFSLRQLHAPDGEPTVLVTRVE